jgi:hypothetical protein
MDSWRNEPELDKRNGDGDKEANRIVSKSEEEREGGGGRRIKVCAEEKTT